eukprot:TRINITY_DN4818_c0_g3_i6.p1 TRINITY_DN4818_c0_g3~~TRINITY_DN4818_c0_g3_i6.p1  ORF type:complete len:1151 (+),score=366.23 TRINITY_DN4818_c0_g3_i6:386-3454(+)
MALRRQTGLSADEQQPVIVSPRKQWQRNSQSTAILGSSQPDLESDYDSQACAEDAMVTAKLRVAAAQRGPGLAVRPDSVERSVVDTCLLVVSGYFGAAVILHDVGHVRVVSSETNVRGWLCTALLFAGIVANFFTASVRDSDVSFDLRVIARNYLRGMFVLDLAGAVPLDLIASHMGHDDAYTGLQHLRLLNLLRIPHLFRLSSPGTMGPGYINWYFRVVPALRNVVYCTLAIHWISCLWIAVQEDQDPESDVTYTKAIYWVLYTITTVGYGDIEVKGTLPKVFACLLFVCGVLMQGLLVGQLTVVVMQGDLQGDRNARMYQTMAVLSHFHVPHLIQEEILGYQYHTLQRNLGALYAELITSLPESMQDQVGLFMRMTFIAQVPMFANSETQVQVALAQSLCSSLIPPDTPVVIAGDQGEEMFFLCYGFCDVLIPTEANPLGGLRVATICKGGFFGENGLISAAKRTATVIALTFVDLFILRKREFDEIASCMPSLADTIGKEIMKRDKAQAATRSDPQPEPEPSPEAEAEHRTPSLQLSGELTAPSAEPPPRAGTADSFGAQHIFSSEHFASSAGTADGTASPQGSPGAPASARKPFNAWARKLLHLKPDAAGLLPASSGAAREQPRSHGGGWGALFKSRQDAYVVPGNAQPTPTGTNEADQEASMSVTMPHFGLQSAPPQAPAAHASPAMASISAAASRWLLGKKRPPPPPAPPSEDAALGEAAAGWSPAAEAVRKLPSHDLGFVNAMSVLSGGPTTLAPTSPLGEISKVASTHLAHFPHSERPMPMQPLQPQGLALQGPSPAQLAIDRAQQRVAQCYRQLEEQIDGAGRARAKAEQGLRGRVDCLVRRIADVAAAVEALSCPAADDLESSQAGDRTPTGNAQRSAGVGKRFRGAARRASVVSRLSKSKRRGSPEALLVGQPDDGGGEDGAPGPVSPPASPQPRLEGAGAQPRRSSQLPVSPGGPMMSPSSAREGIEPAPGFDPKRARLREAGRIASLIDCGASPRVSVAGSKTPQGQAK